MFLVGSDCFQMFQNLDPAHGCVATIRHLPCWAPGRWNCQSPSPNSTSVHLWALPVAGQGLGNLGVGRANQPTPLYHAAIHSWQSWSSNISLGFKHQDIGTVVLLKTCYATSCSKSIHHPQLSPSRSTPGLPAWRCSTSPELRLAETEPVKAPLASRKGLGEWVWLERAMVCRDLALEGEPMGKPMDQDPRFPPISFSINTASHAVYWQW